MQKLTITASGPDRAGLVDELTEALIQQGANIADSRMINLRGRFAVLMLVEVPEERAREACRDLAAAAESVGLAATVQVLDEPTPPPAPAVPYRIRTYAMDQVGLVHKITHALHVMNVNIEELNTKLEHAPHTGAPLFSMDMVVSVPQDVTLDRVRQELEQLCAELNCDLDIDQP